jgi:hypothetical protein
VVEHLPYKEGVTGSSPVAPTQLSGRFRSWDRPLGTLVQQQSAAAGLGQQRSGAEALAELPERGSRGWRGHLRIDLHGQGDLAVTQDLHGDPRVDLDGGKQRSARAASAVHRNPEDLRQPDPPVEAAVEVTRLDGRAMAGGEYQAGLDPGPTCPGTVSLLLLPAEPECGDAEVRKGEWRVGGFGLGLAAQELVVNALYLLADVQLARAEIDQVPGEPEQFASAQAENEDQDVGRIQYVIVAAGGLQELAGLIGGPRPALALGVPATG